MGIRELRAGVGVVIVVAGCQPSESRDTPRPGAAEAVVEARGIGREGCTVGPLRSPLALGVSVCANVDGRKAQVLDGGVLYTDDRLSLLVEATEPLYFYLVQEQQGAVGLVWPEQLAEATQLEPGSEHELPAGKDLVMDEHVGPLKLHFIASARRLEIAAPELHAELARLGGGWGRAPSLATSTANEKASAGRWPRQTVPGLERGGRERGVVVRDRVSGTITAELDANGVAEAVFNIQHRQAR